MQNLFTSSRVTDSTFWFSTHAFNRVGWPCQKLNSVNTEAFTCGFGYMFRITFLLKNPTTSHLARFWQRQTDFHFKYVNVIGVPYSRYKQGASFTNILVNLCVNVALKKRKILHLQKPVI